MKEKTKKIKFKVLMELKLTEEAASIIESDTEHEIKDYVLAAERNMSEFLRQNFTDKDVSVTALDVDVEYLNIEIKKAKEESVSE